jgi:iron complex transport system permease protein
MTRPALVTGALAAAYLGLALLGTAWGPAAIPPGHVLRVLAGAAGAGQLAGRDCQEAAAVPSAERFLVLHVRLPQVLLLGLVGAALACSGAALQATFENPLADPGVLGVSGGAALGAVLAIHTGLAETVFLSLPVCAFTGGLTAALLVYALTYLGGRPTAHALLLTGVAVGSMTVAGVSLVMVLTQQHRVQELLFWLVGGVRNQTWEHVGLAAPAIALGVAGLLGLHRPLDALLLGEEQALAVGVSAVRTRLLVLALAALATGAATAVSGTIGFVGLIVPHLVRRFTGPRTLHLLPGCVAGGSAFLTACELLSCGLSERFSLHLGILTAFLGGPAFLIVLRQTARGRA